MGAVPLVSTYLRKLCPYRESTAYIWPYPKKRASIQFRDSTVTCTTLGLNAPKWINIKIGTLFRHPKKIIEAYYLTTNTQKLQKKPASHDTQEKKALLKHFLARKWRDIWALIYCWFAFCSFDALQRRPKIIIWIVLRESFLGAEIGRGDRLGDRTPLSMTTPIVIRQICLSSGNTIEWGGKYNPHISADYSRTHPIHNAPNSWDPFRVLGPPPPPHSDFPKPARAGNINAE